MNVDRRQFLIGALAAGAVMTAEGLWVPGQKLISIPSKKIFLPAGHLAFIEGGVTKVFRSGRSIVVPDYFDVQVRGAEISRDEYVALERRDLDCGRWGKA